MTADNSFSPPEARPPDCRECREKDIGALPGPMGTNTAWSGGTRERPCCGPEAQVRCLDCGTTWWTSLPDDDR